MIKKNIKIAAFLLVAVVANQEVFSQNPLGQEDRDQKRGRNVITTAVPSMLIGPDSRTGAMGEAGVAIDNDMNAQHWNSSKYVQFENPYGATFSFSPWLAGLGVNDIYLAYLAGYTKIGNANAVSFALRYFSMGEMQFTNDQGEDLNKFSPHEFSIDAGYSRILVENLSMGMTGRFIYSQLSNIMQGGGNQTDVKPGMAAAVDVSLFYSKNLKSERAESNKIAWGLCISNIGNRISYNSSIARSYLPTNFRTGIAYTVGIDKFHKLTFAFDLNKLLVPSPPIWLRDSANRLVLDPTGAPQIASGKDPIETNPASALITSWYDAPGRWDEAKGKYVGKFGEEMAEFIQNFGMEYGYSDVFFIRTGFFNEAATKGNRKYMTFGVGVKYSIFCIDASYILPVSARHHPLQNTLRFSVSFDFAAKKNKKDKQ